MFTQMIDFKTAVGITEFIVVESHKVIVSSLSLSDGWLKGHVVSHHRHMRYLCCSVEHWIVKSLSIRWFLHTSVFSFLKFILSGHCCSFWITCFQTGVGIHGDVAKLHHDYRVRIQGIVDLSSMANKKLGTGSWAERYSVRQWSLSSLAQALTGKQVRLLSLWICDK